MFLLFFTFVREITKLNEELELLNQETQQTESRLDLKKKQFQLLLYSIQQLQVIDEEEKSQKLQSTPPSASTLTPISNAPSISSLQALPSDAPTTTETEGILFYGN